MKTDARVRYTQHIITTVFLDLLKKKSLEAITVKEICEKAEINRSTFYKHYPDVYGVMEELEDEAIHAFEALLLSTDTANTRTLLETILHALSDNQDIFQTSMTNETCTHFIEKLSTRCMKYVTPLLPLSPSLPPQYTFFALQYINGGITNIIQEWMKNGMKESPMEMAALIEAFNSGVLNAIAAFDDRPV